MVKGYKSLKIKDVEDIPGTLQRIANLVFNGEMDTTTANCLNNLVKTRVQVANVLELQAQVEVLEDLLQSKEAEQLGSE